MFYKYINQNVYHIHKLADLVTEMTPQLPGLGRMGALGRPCSSDPWWGQGWAASLKVKEQPQWSHMGNYL